MASRFYKTLLELNDKIDLPQPTKARIILEISSDLEDAYNFLLEKGYDEESAQQKALEQIMMSDQDLQELVNIHQSSLQKLMEQLSARTKSRWEKISLVIILIVFSSVTGNNILTKEFINETSIFIWPAIILGFLAFVLILIKWYKLYLKKEHKLKYARNGLPLLLLLAGASLFIGILGFATELFWAGNSVLQLIFSAVLEPASPESLSILNQVVTFGLKTSSLLMFTHLMAILIATSWYIFNIKITKITSAEFENLLK